MIYLIKIYYNEFKNLATQVIKDVDFLPLKQFDSNEQKKQLDRLFEPSKKHPECHLGRCLALLGFGSWSSLESSMKMLFAKTFSKI